MSTTFLHFSIFVKYIILSIVYNICNNVKIFCFSYYKNIWNKKTIDEITTENIKYAKSDLSKKIDKKPN